MRRHHSTEPPELRPHDRARTADVHRILAANGVPHSTANDPLAGGHRGAVPAWANAHMPDEYHAVEVVVWARDAAAVDDRDALADRIRRVLWDAGYLVHENGRGLDITADNGGVHRDILYVYQPHWGGDLPEITLVTSNVASMFGITTATWRGYVSRGQAPEPDAPIDGRTPAWRTSTIDRWRRDRPGQGTRTDLT